MYHPGQTIFTMTMFLQNQHHRFVDLRLAARSPIKVFETMDLEEEGELALWDLVVGGIWMWDNSEGKWLAERLWRVSQGLGLTSWDKTYWVLRKFPWIDHITTRLTGRHGNGRSSPVRHGKITWSLQ